MDAHFYVFLDVLDRWVFFQMALFYCVQVTSALCVGAFACVLCQAVYSASFPEDIPVNKGILTVAATDADSGSSAEIQYSLFGIGVEDFYMDANTGKYGCCCCCCCCSLYAANITFPNIHLHPQASSVRPPSWTERRPPATNSSLRQQMEAGCSAAVTFH